MGKGLLVFIVIGSILAYILIGFVNDLQSEDDRLNTQEKMIQKQDRAYYQKDAIGQTVLVFKEMPYDKKVGIWKRSPLHQEFLSLFPNFSEMKTFVNDHINDKDFKQRLSRKVGEIEDAYFSGEIDQERAKEKLDTL